MKAPEEIAHLKRLIKNCHSIGVCPPTSTFNNLLDGRAKGYINAMESLGQIVIEDDKIVLTN